MSEQFEVSIRLPAHPASVGVARGIIRSLVMLVDPACLDQAELVMSEIVTNSIRHGTHGSGRPIEVDLVASRMRLVGEVRDPGPAFDLPSEAPEARQIGGYGLHIARALCDLAISHSEEGNIVRFAIPPST